MSSRKDIYLDPIGDLWTQHEPVIRRLYEVERKTLKEVKKMLEAEYNFPVTP